MKFYYYVVLILVKIQKKSNSTHSSSKGAANAYFLTGSFSKKTWLFEAVVFLVNQKTGTKRGAKFRGELSPQS